MRLDSRLPALAIVVPAKLKTRGAVSNPQGRFERFSHIVEDDGWFQEEADAVPLQRILMPDKAKTIITYNQSPDIPFDRSINPYRGCEHGCIYCFARPTHSYLDLSPGLDFETHLFYKADALTILEEELRQPNYDCKPITFGINTDAYQPIEKELRLTRQLLELLLDYRHPVNLITKSVLILRDLDILQELANFHLVSVTVSMTSLQQSIKNTLEPRTASPSQRLALVRRLAENKIPVGVLCAPVIPAITDHELEQILEQARAAGACYAGYVLLRLPHELKAVFSDWLNACYPDRADHVFSLLKQSHQGEVYRSAWGVRQRGTGVYADMLQQRFQKALQRYDYPDNSGSELDCSLFRLPPRAGDQLSLSF